MTNETDNGVAPEQKQENRTVITTNSPEVVETPVEPSEETEKPEIKPEGEKKRERPGRVERENARLKAELDAMRQQTQSNGAKKPEAEPKESDFDNLWDYNKALARFEAIEAVKAERAEQEAIKLEEAHDEREDAFIDQNPDYEDKVNYYRASGLLTQDIQKEVLKSSISEKVAYYLASYPGDALTVYQYAQQGNKAAVQQAVKQIETFLKDQPASEPVRATQAAAPITPPKSNTAAIKVGVPTDFQDFVKRAAPIR